MRARLLERARADERIAGAAITGSAASDAEDPWSDIDLFFGVAEAAYVASVLADWSDSPTTSSARCTTSTCTPAPRRTGHSPSGTGSRHHVVHARTSIERGAPWQAEYWISGVRDHTIALARTLGPVLVELAAPP